MDALSEFLKDRTSPFYIPCLDKADRDSKRARLIHQRKKLPAHLQELIGIKNQDIGGRFFVTIYNQETTAYRLVEGVFTPVEFEEAPAPAQTQAPDLGFVPSFLPSLPSKERSEAQRVERMKNQMREDGKTEEEIESYFAELEAEKLDVIPPLVDDGKM